VHDVALAALGLPTRRPRYSALASERASLLRPLDASIAAYARDRAVA
jgi:hypothetical protein